MDSMKITAATATAVESFHVFSWSDASETVLLYLIWLFLSSQIPHTVPLLHARSLIQVCRRVADPFLVLISLPKTESRVPVLAIFARAGKTLPILRLEERLVVMHSHSRPLLRKERGIRNSFWKRNQKPSGRPAPAFLSCTHSRSRPLLRKERGIGTLVWERDQKPTEGPATPATHPLGLVAVR